MYRVEVFFYGDLNFFLTGKNRKREGEVFFREKRSVKDLVESFGVPHVEIDTLLVNGSPVDFSYIVADNDRIEVFPGISAPGCENSLKLKPETDCETAFVLDVHLKKLASRMRLLGLDSEYSDRMSDPEIAFISSSQNRMVLTRDRQLLMRREVVRGMYVMSRGTENQIREVLERLNLWNCCRPFTRCIRCNGELGIIEDISQIRKSIPPGVLRWCSKYHSCSSCGKIYWEGSHFERLKKIVGEILNRRE